MRLEFKLNQEQIPVAESAVDRYYRGLDDSHAMFNPDQALEIKGNSLIYQGQRHPFRQDGAYDAILTVFGSRDAATAAIFLYSTSDPRLAWWETQDEYYERAYPSDIQEDLWKRLRPNQIEARRDGHICGRSWAADALMRRAYDLGIITPEIEARLADGLNSYYEAQKAISDALWEAAHNEICLPEEA